MIAPAAGASRQSSTWRLCLPCHHGRSLSLLNTVPSTGTIPAFLTARELAERHRTSEGHLANQRQRGEGVPYLLRGRRVLYPLHLVEEWETAHLVRPAKAAA